MSDESGLRYFDEWGAHGVTEQPSPCGCRVVGVGNLPDPLRVQFCAAHHAVVSPPIDCNDPEAIAAHPALKTVGWVHLANMGFVEEHGIAQTKRERRIFVEGYETAISQRQGGK